MTPRLLGFQVRFLLPETLVAALRGDAVAPGRRFLARFEAAAWTRALEEVAGEGELGEAAALALGDVVLQLGEPGGFVDLEGVPAETFARTLGDVLQHVLGDAAASERLLSGGVLERRAAGLGSLPLEWLTQRLDRRALDLARREAQAPWVSEWLNTLESAAAVAQRAPAAHLVLVPEWALESAATSAAEASAPASPSDEDEEPFPLVELLREAGARAASDLHFVAGAPPLAESPAGRQPLRAQALTTEDTRRLAYSFLSDRQVERFEREGTLVTGFGVRGLGRYRLALTRERGVVGASLRVLPPRPPTLAQLGLPSRAVRALENLERGLVVIGGASGSGRSTSLAALGQSWLDAGATLGSVEEPVAFTLVHGAGLARQVDATEDARPEVALRALTLGAADVVAVDLVDDALGAELALDAAAAGRLVVLTLRGLSLAALVHRLVAADAQHQRRRLAEALALVLCQARVPEGAGWRVEVEALVPSEALRRHLRALDTMPPAAVLEPDDEV